jgi:hypothetical protein
MPSFEMVRSRATRGVDVAYFGRHPSEDRSVRAARALWFVMGMILALVVVMIAVSGSSTYWTFYSTWPGCLWAVGLAVVWIGGMLLTRWYGGLKGSPWNGVVEVTVVADAARDLDSLLTDILALDGSDDSRLAALTERAHELKASRRTTRREEVRWTWPPSFIPAALGVLVMVAVMAVPVFTIAYS